MSQLEIERVLSQIRALRPDAPLAGATRVPESDQSRVSFAAVLKNGLDQVSAAQAKASASVSDFEMGKPGADLAQAMIDMQKASVSFRAAVEVRNKLVSAYQDIMNMPV